MTQPLIERIGLIAGEGELPVYVAQNALKMGTEVVAFTLGKNNLGDLKRLCKGRIHSITPGLVQRTYTLLQQESIRFVVFAGKVNKWILLKNPRMDEEALRILQQMTRKNDDSVMLGVVNELERRGIKVLNQTDYLQNLFLPAGLLTKSCPPSQRDKEDIRYGFEVAKEMGRLDIGQTIVVNDGMILAVEAIEGTDECLKRAGKWGAKKGGVVVKVAKPDQDQRFDVPTVGLRTLKTMKKAGLHLLATDAEKTLFLEPDAMVSFAHQHGITIVSYEGNP